MKLKKPLPKAAVIGGIVTAGLLVLLLGWMVVISPQHKKAAKLVKDTEAVQQQITQQLAAVAAAKSAAVSPAPKIKVADVYKLSKAMPSSADVPDILLQLSQVAQDSGVQLQSISPAGTQLDAATGQTQLMYSLAVEGDFYTVTDLLYRLRNLVSVRSGALNASGRVWTVDNVSFAPAGRQLTVNLSLHTYVYGAPAVVAPAPTVAPTDTSTDTTTTESTDSGGPSAAGAP